MVILILIGEFFRGTELGYLLAVEAIVTGKEVRLWRLPLQRSENYDGMDSEGLGWGFPSPMP